MTRKTGPDDAGSFGKHRRTLLKAVGGGAGLALLAGQTAAGSSSEHEDDSDREDDSADDGSGSQNGDTWCSPCIDRLAGYTALAGEDGLPAEPDHVVDMYIEPRHVLFQEAQTEEAEVEPGVEPGDPEEMPEEFPDFFFDPVGLRVNAGDVVEFYNESDIHTITAIHPRFLGLPQRIPDGAPPFSSPPVANEERWLYRFDVPGVYDLLCLPHFELGMVMRVVVTEGTCPAPAADEFPEEGFPPAVQTVFGAPELAVENIVDAGSVAWDDLTIDERLDPSTMFGE